MKKHLLILPFLLVLVLALAACNGNSPHGTAGAGYDNTGTATVNAGLDVNSNVNVAVNGNYNVPTGNWSAGFTITFKDAIPGDVAEQIVAAGGKQLVRDANTWCFPDVKSPADPNYVKAITAAAGAGADFTVTALK